jgi:hypothetical protein
MLSQVDHSFIWVPLEFHAKNIPMMGYAYTQKKTELEKADFWADYFK